MRCFLGEITGTKDGSDMGLDSMLKIESKITPKIL